LANKADHDPLGYTEEEYVERLLGGQKLQGRVHPERVHTGCFTIADPAAT
jgi:hypothetical protein